MTQRFRNPSPELYLLVSALASVLVAAIATQITALAFARFGRMVTVLLLADLVLYISMKVGVVAVSKRQGR